MKVLLVGDFPEDDKTYGGVEGVLVNLAHGLIQRPQIQVVLVSTSIDSSFNGFEDRCTSYKVDFRSSVLKARRIFKEIVAIEGPDIIHLQGVVPGVLLFRKEYRDIFIVTQHAILREERLWQVSLKRKMLFMAKELIENYYFKRIQNIIFISEYNRKIYKEKVGNASGINSTLIPNPVNKLFFQLARQTGQTGQTGQTKNNELYFVGEVKKRKGLHILLKALKILSHRKLECKLHVIGGFREKPYEAEVKELITSLNLTDNIIFCGWKNQKEVMEYSRDIPVFVLPSFQETLPLSIAEAISQGKIVVATDICGVPEMIENRVSGYLFPKGDALELANILQQIFEDLPLQKEISRKALIGSERYHPQNVLDQTLEFYKKVSNQSSA